MLKSINGKSNQIEQALYIQIKAMKIINILFLFWKKSKLLKRIVVLREIRLSYQLLIQKITIARKEPYWNEFNAKFPIFPGKFMLNINMFHEIFYCLISKICFNIPARNSSLFVCRKKTKRDIDTLR